MTPAIWFKKYLHNCFVFESSWRVKVSLVWAWLACLILLPDQSVKYYKFSLFCWYTLDTHNKASAKQKDSLWHFLQGTQALSAIIKGIFFYSDYWAEALPTVLLGSFISRPNNTDCTVTSELMLNLHFNVLAFQNWIHAHGWPCNQHRKINYYLELHVSESH